MEYLIPEGISVRGVFPTPRKTAFWMPTVSSAALKALRTRGSSKGFLVVLKPI